MSAGFEIKKFFRKMDTALIQRYFKEKHHLVFCQNEQKKEAVTLKLQWEAWLALPEKIRIQAESDFIQIDDLCNERGIRAILDEADFHGSKQSLLDEWKDKPVGFRVFSIFLDHQPFWQGAQLFSEADAVPNSRWRKRKNLPHIDADVSAHTTATFAQHLGEYFFQETGKGKNCHIEIYRRDNRDYFFAYPEDYAKETLEWTGNRLQSHAAKQAYMIIFLYIKDEGTLDIHCKGITEQLNDLQAMFARDILHCDRLPDNPKDSRIYHFEKLLDRNFDFAIPTNSPVKKMVVSKMRLSSSIGKGIRILLEAPDWKNNPMQIYDVLNQFNQYGLMKNHLPTLVEIKAIYAKENGKEATKTITLTWPNGCTLQREGVDALLTGILKQSGIESLETANGATA